MVAVTPPDIYLVGDVRRMHILQDGHTKNVASPALYLDIFPVEPTDSAVRCLNSYRRLYAVTDIAI